MVWKKVDEYTKFEFKQAGDLLEGRLIDCKATQYDSKVYTLVGASGKGYYFFGCYKLDDMLPALLGRFIEIKYLGKTKIKEGQMLKDFEIAIWSDDEGKVPDGFQDDVPF